MAQGPEVPISLHSVTENNLMLLKKLNASIFPPSGDVLASDIIRNTEKYDAQVLASGEFTKLAYYDDICVGAIASQLEKTKTKDGPVRIYIMSLGVLLPYRRLGIGTRLLNHVLELSSKENASEVYLHVQTNNNEAKNFFKKAGFKVKEMKLNYFKDTKSPDCYVLNMHMASTSKTDKDATTSESDKQSGRTNEDIS